MGLDMYAYVARRDGQQRDFYDQEGLEWDSELGDYRVPDGGITKPREIAYWRKHPNLHGWMHNLWNRKGFNGEFNGDELELTWDDLEELKRTVIHKQLPTTGGFFFGERADDIYYEDDLKFIRDAQAEIFCGLRVFYNSSW